MTWQVNTTSIIVDATTYIEELKEKVETIDQEIGGSGTSSDQNLPMVLPVFQQLKVFSRQLLNTPFGMRFFSNHLQEVDVQTLDKGGFHINVHSDRNCPGLLVSILEAFEALGLDVLDARVSCAHSFHLEAVGGEVS